MTTTTTATTTTTRKRKTYRNLTALDNDIDENVKMICRRMERHLLAWYEALVAKKGKEHEVRHLRQEIYMKFSQPLISVYEKACDAVENLTTAAAAAETTTKKRKTPAKAPVVVVRWWQDPVLDKLCT